MISVLIECDGEAEALAATLAALVPGAVEGLVSDVIVVDRRGDADTAAIADAAGCRYVDCAGFAEALQAARGEWLMLLEPGARPLPGWIEEVGAHIGYEKRPARFKRARHDKVSLLTRWKEQRSPLAFGLVMPKSQGWPAGGAKIERLRDMAKSVRAIRLDCAIATAGQHRGANARRGAA